MSNMNLSFTHPLFLLLVLALSIQFKCSSSSFFSLRKGSSLSVEEPEDILISPNGMFSAGFLAIGENAYSFAIWFTEPNSPNPTITWMANSDQPVNGKHSKLSLLHSGNIVLVDVGLEVWSSKTESSAPLEFHLKNDGNLVLRELQGTTLWQSFDFPTNTLLPGQSLTRYTKLVSSRSDSNHSSGFYKFFFDDENVLGLHYDGPEVSSSYWPKPWLIIWDAGRSNYNSSRIAVLNSLGLFNSTDNFTFITSDYGTMLQRRLKLDSDGNVRVYSRSESDVSGKWYVSWQAISITCTVHGICGPYSTCSYSPKKGRKCSCIPGYKLKKHSDWSDGCEPKFDLTCNTSNEYRFLELRGVEFYGYDNHYVEISNYSACEDLCSRDCNCVGFQHSWWDDKGLYRCLLKTQLLNGRHTPSFTGNTYLKLPKGSSFTQEEESATPYDHVCSVELQRDYVRTSTSPFLKFFLWLATAIGAFEMVCLFVVWCFLIKTHQNSHPDQHDYHLATIGFRNFSYSELKKATKGFKQEIGRGAGGIVYKGLLSDQRHAAIKRLYDADQGEGVFLAEVGIIGRLNHMNLIEMWGYCAEGKHRLLVCEYMENGSLAENLSSNTLDWSKRYKIALGIARVLAYLHEECLEWILHCDIKPQNILLDSNYMPKLADFGLSKLHNRNNLNNSSISMIRGTRGYLAPEWILNLPITSKVDVYSYGIVVLELITGKSPTTGIQIADGEKEMDGRLVTWVREKRSNLSWVEQIIDPAIGPNYDKSKMEILARVALDCVVKDKDSRPTMSQVVEMLSDS